MCIRDSLTAAAVCLHSQVLLPSVEWMKESVYKWVYLYDCSELSGDCSKWWDDCCMDVGCTDGVPYRLPEMTVDDEDAIYDEETGAVVTPLINFVNATETALQPSREPRFCNGLRALLRPFVRILLALPLVRTEAAGGVVWAECSQRHRRSVHK